MYNPLCYLGPLAPAYCTARSFQEKVLGSFHQCIAAVKDPENQKWVADQALFVFSNVKTACQHPMAPVVFSATAIGSMLLSPGKYKTALTTGTILMGVGIAATAAETIATQGITNEQSWMLAASGIALVAKAIHTQKPTIAPAAPAPTSAATAPAPSPTAPAPAPVTLPPKKVPLPQERDRKEPTDSQHTPLTSDVEKFTNHPNRFNNNSQFDDLLPHTTSHSASTSDYGAIVPFYSKMPSQSTNPHLTNSMPFWSESDVADSSEKMTLNDPKMVSYLHKIEQAQKVVGSDGPLLFSEDKLSCSYEKGETLFIIQYGVSETKFVPISTNNSHLKEFLSSNSNSGQTPSVEREETVQETTGEENTHIDDNIFADFEEEEESALFQSQD